MQIYKKKFKKGTTSQDVQDDAEDRLQRLIMLFEDHNAELESDIEINIEIKKI